MVFSSTIACFRTSLGAWESSEATLAVSVYRFLFYGGAISVVVVVV
jgi:hypothetical protein